MPEYIARISYGKDSLKMLDVIFTRNLPLDRITTTDVWATDTVSANLPPMEEFKARMDERIWNLYRVDVEHLCARNKDGTKRTYEQMFYHVPNRRSQNGKVERERERRASARLDPRLPRPLEPVVSSWTQAECQATECRERSPGSLPTPDTTTARSSRLLQTQFRDFRCLECLGAKADSRPVQRPQGFPVQISPWCKKLKIDMVRTPLSEERPTRRRNRNIVEYLGIAADEPARFGQLNERKRAPLVEFGIDEDLCGLYCQYGRCLAPTYDTSCRDGCWFCHNQGVDSLRNLWRNYPDHWALLLKWDKDSPVTFKADGHTVHDFDRRFRMEAEGWIDTHRPFRWAMLDNPPKFRATNFDEISLFEKRKPRGGNNDENHVG